MINTLRGIASQAKSVFVPNSSPKAATGWSKPGVHQTEDLLTNAVVLDSNENALNPELLQILLRTIFEKNPQILSLVEQRLPSVKELATIRGAEQAIEEVVINALRSGETGAEAMASDYFAHKVSTADNARAYSPAGRENQTALFWPNPLHPEKPRSIHDELPFLKNIPLVDKKTKIVSMGSCFAFEIAYALQREGFNYVVKEPNKAEDGSWWYRYHTTAEFPQSSAGWGIHFNTPSFLQVVEKAFGYRRPAKVLWTNYANDGKTLVYCDPFREEIEFASPQAFEANYEQHIHAAREALLEAELLIVTLGLNEVWYFKPDGSVFSRSPWKSAPSFVEHRVLTVQENVQALQRMYDLLKTHNPQCKLIVTLSPVPLHATFFGDTKHIIEANSHSKAVLRCAAEDFVNANDDAYYFPSYELVTNCLQNPWHPDQRHVTREAVGNVMVMFKKMFGKPEIAG